MKNKIIIILILFYTQIYCEELIINKLHSFNIGNKENELGYDSSYVDHYMTSGPTAFCIDIEGNYHFVDTYNWRIISFTKEFKYVKHVQLSFSDRIIFSNQIFISKDKKYLYSRDTSGISYIHKESLFNTNVRADLLESRGNHACFIIDNRFYYKVEESKSEYLPYIENGKRYDIDNENMNNVIYLLEEKLLNNINDYSQLSIYSTNINTHRDVYNEMHGEFINGSKVYDRANFSESKTWFYIGKDSNGSSFWKSKHNKRFYITVLSHFGEVLEKFILPADYWYRHKPVVNNNGDLFFMIYDYYTAKNIDIYSLTKESRIKQREKNNKY